ncbi:LPP20 family lipoprotein [Carboxylicivirga taeanensis]|uniref:LPP20 family lipoprotein n=1 Tax=Carboxylicivirga taeanensis TaxID=1416875 RepID=UPI003F6DC847
MRGLAFLALALTLLCSCSSKKKEAELLELSKPEWLKNRPMSSTYFYGIGISPKVGGAVFYEGKAKEKALADLSQQISTKISSEQNLYRMEDNSGVYEYYQSRVKAQSQQFLEGYELLDSWEDLTNYYTFYRLSKSEFYARKKQRKAEALQLSLQKYELAQAAQQQKDFILALEQYAAAIDAISDYLNEQTTIETAQGSIDLFEAEKEAMCDIINGFQIDCQTSTMHSLANTNIAEGKTSLIVKCENMTAHNIPVRFNYSGGFLVADRFQSDTQGLIKSPAFKTTGSTQETLTATVDLKALGRLMTKNLIVRQIVEKQKPAESSITIQLAQ